jgi:hypothetical protein
MIITECYACRGKVNRDADHATQVVVCLSCITKACIDAKMEWRPHDYPGGWLASRYDKIYMYWLDRYVEENGGCPQCHTFHR